MTTVITTTPTATSIATAVERLVRGELVAFPTETVYGLGGSTLDEDALHRIYAMKGRPSSNPLIAHVSGPGQARTLVRDWDERCDMLADMFWPGSLTLVLPREESVPAIASGGRDTLAVRCPGHEVALELLGAFGGPISAPSANRSGSVSPTTARHVQQDYEGIQEASGLLVLDGGPCTVGIESTVLDLSADSPRVLRPGSITTSQLSALIGPVEQVSSTEQGASPGTSLRHYAPATPVELVDAGAVADRLAEHAGRVVIISSGPCECGVEKVFELPTTPGGYAESIYSTLRDADGLGLDLILVIRPGGDQPGWDAVIDRITRASRSGEHDG